MINMTKNDIVNNECSQYKTQLINLMSETYGYSKQFLKTKSLCELELFNLKKQLNQYNMK